MAIAGKDKDSVRSACERALAGVNEGLSWTRDPANQDLLGPARVDLERGLRKGVVTLRKLAAATDRPMCVGVFGPSQAGKSYLVSVLARRGANPVIALLGGEEIDFLAKINPEGGRESTGLVTRFSVTPAPHPSGFPVALRLLSVADIAKIFANTFNLDGDQKVEAALTRERIEAALNAARAEAQSAPSPGLTEEDVWDIQDYVNRQFDGRTHVDALKAFFWDEAARLAPRLNAAGRARLLAVLWNEHAPFTNLFRELSEALAKVGHAGEVFAELDALLPREKSVIDVAALNALGDPNSETIRIMSPSGVVSLRRAVAAAVTAELRITIKDRPWDFMEHTDLLDFPGARSRQAVRLSDFLDKPGGEGLKEAYLRGRVAFLFDRYSEEQELACILLCLRDSNQEVVTLPNMVAEWVEQTHGATPEARRAARTLLFIVLTMFDRHLVDSGGQSEDDGERFRNRLHASISGFLARAHSWPKEWTPGRPFNNTYWLRNPTYKAEHIIRYDGPREVEVLPEKVSRVATLKSGFLGAEGVREFFAEPEAAWEAAMALNDGGVSYLAQNLTPICRFELKLDQIGARLGVVTGGLWERLRAFYQSEDLAQRMNERLASAQTVLLGLSQSAERYRFAATLSQMMLAQGELVDAFQHAFLRGPGEDAIPAAPTTNQFAGLTLPGMPAPQTTPKAQSGAGGRPARLARVALEYWIAKMTAFTQSPRLVDGFGLESGQAAELVNECVAGARRIDLEGALARELTEQAFIERPEIVVARAATIATARINAYVAHLGSDATPLEQRPGVVDAATGARRAVFAPRPVRHDALGIGKEPAPYARKFVEDWMHAFYRLVEENAKVGAGVGVDPAQNARLGKILDALRPTER